MPDDTRPTFGQALEAAAEAAPSTSTPSVDAPSSASSVTDASSASTPATSTVSTDLAPHAAAATQPGAGDGSTPTATDETAWDEAQGPIPVQRHKAILEHTRTRARDDAKADVQREYGWALSLGAQQFQTVSDFARQAATDPVQFALGILDELTASPQYATQLRSHVARILATRQKTGANGGNGHAAAASEEIAEPQPDMLVDGYAWYSAKQQAERDRWLTNKLLTQVRSEMAPLQQDREQRQQAQQQYEIKAAANQFATDTLAEMHKLPHFKEQKGEIERVFREMPPMPDQMVGQAIRDAYIQVLVTKVLPTLSSTAKSDLLSSLNQKAAASSRNPAQGGVAVASRPKTFDEALRQEHARRGGQAFR